jgi:hypothetical protein
VLRLRLIVWDAQPQVLFDVLMVNVSVMDLNAWSSQEMSVQVIDHLSVLWVNVRHHMMNVVSLMFTKEGI